MANWTATIGGTLVNVVAGSLRVQNQIGQRSQGSLQVWSGLSTWWEYGTRVAVYDESSTLRYSGYTTKDRVSRPAGSRQGSGFLLHDLSLMDNAYRADKRRVFKFYANVSAGFIVNDLLTSYLAVEGVTSTASSIAAGPTITEVIWNGTKSVAEALTWLAQQSGYWWQIDLNGALFFQPYGGVAAPFVLDGTDADSLQTLSVEYGNDMYINRQYSKGSFAQTAQLTETFHGDGLTRNFTLSYPLSTLSSLTLNGTDITSNVTTKGDSSGSYHASAGDPVIAQDPSQTVLTSGDTLVAVYKGRYPVLAMAQNSALIAAQKAREGVGSGFVEAIYSDAKVRTLSAAFQIASALLAHYGTNTTVASFTTRTSGLAPGQMLTVNLPDFGFNGQQMLVNSVTISDQHDGINIWYEVQAVGAAAGSSSNNTAVESAQWQTYWQNLMSQSSDPSDTTDTADTSLALLSTSNFSTAGHSFTVTQSQHTGPICGVSMLCGSWTVA